MAKQLLLVLGMGRSGTSAMTRILSLCGAGLSEQLLGANPSNPRGHWESQEALDLNRSFLSRFSSGWHDPSFRLQLDPVVQQSARHEYELAIGGFLQGAFRTTDIVVVKDPRISGLAPSWLRAATQLECETKIIHMFRRLEGVALSLAKRDKITRDYAKALWLKYHLQCERDCRNQNRVFVEFPNFFLNWQEIVSRIFRELQIDLRVTPDATISINEFIDTARAPEPVPVEQSGFTDLWVATIYEWMCSAASGGFPDPRVLDQCYAEITSAEGMYRNSFAQFWAGRGKWY